MRQDQFIITRSSYRVGQKTKRVRPSRFLLLLSGLGAGWAEGPRDGDHWRRRQRCSCTTFSVSASDLRPSWRRHLCAADTLESRCSRQSQRPPLRRRPAVRREKGEKVWNRRETSCSSVATAVTAHSHLEIRETPSPQMMMMTLRLKKTGEKTKQMRERRWV